jgi:hypothetical protein
MLLITIQSCVVSANASRCLCKCTASKVVIKCFGAQLTHCALCIIALSLLPLQVASNRATQVTGGDDRNVKLALDPAKVELMSLTDPAACIRTLTTVRGGLAIIDDGSIPDLTALARVRSIVGPLIIYGRANASLTSLAGLDNLQVRAAVKNAKLTVCCCVRAYACRT